MNYNTLPTPVLVGNATFDVGGATLTFEECVGKFQKMAGTTARARKHAVRQEVACGAFLITCRGQMPDGVWGRFIQRIGVNRKTVTRQVQMAMRLSAREPAADGHGGERLTGKVDAAKFEAAVRAWNAGHPVGHPLHIPQGPVSLARVQYAVGVRAEPRTRNEQAGDRWSQGVRVDVRGGAASNSLPLGGGAHNAPPSFPDSRLRNGGVQTPPVAGSLLSLPVVPAVKDRGAGFDGRHSGRVTAQLSLADEYEAVQAERLRLEAMLAEIAELVQVSGGGGVDVRGALQRIGGDVEGLLREVRGQ